MGLNEVIGRENCIFCFKPDSQCQLFTVNCAKLVPAATYIYSAIFAADHQYRFLCVYGATFTRFLLVLWIAMYAGSNLLQPMRSETEIADFALTTKMHGERHNRD